MMIASFLAPNNQLCIFSYDLGAPTRYRIDHHTEQAQLAGIPTQQATSHTSLLLPASALYLHRVPLTSHTLPLVLAAKLRRVPIVFDSDDLVWDPRERAYNYLDRHYTPQVVEQILKTTRRMHAMMRLADAFVFSTPYLAQRAALDFRQPSYVNANALSQEQIALSEAARRNRVHDEQNIVIGYFSGQSKVHDEDMATIGPALRDTLDRYQHVCLRLVGGLTLPPELASSEYRARIAQHDATDWRALPAQIAQVDINLAPLVDNPQRRAKSAVKYLEAAAVSVPTVAARLDPYADIVHGETGMLAWTSDEWRSGLCLLIEDAALRQRIGTAAHADVLAQHTTAARAPNFAAIIRQIVR